jgi:hypothetical protein
VLVILLLILQWNKVSAEVLVQSSQKIESFASKQGFFQNTVHSITADNNGYLWIATPNGLVRYDGYSFEYFYHDYHNPESIPGNKIKHLLNDSNGKLWIGTDQGLCLYLTEKEQFIPLQYKISNEIFIKEDAQKRIWVGKGTNLHVFNSDLQVSAMVDEAVLINFENELNGENILDVEFVTDSVILLATSSMIYKVTFNDNQSYLYEIQKLFLNLNNKEIITIKKIDDIVWIGTTMVFIKVFLKTII